MSTGKHPPKHFILYDGRAKSGDTDDAAVLDVCDTEGEARHASKQHRGVDAIWYECVLAEGSTGKKPVYEEVGPRWDIGKGVLR